ncbi:MAG: uridine kinase [Prevotellaceae bacterium]|nr:uridine kinase [Candidatus Minthosoma caballi]
MVIIGVTGGTGSGKTSVVRRITECFPNGTFAVIPQDSYYYDLSHVPFEQRRLTNFDHPDAFDWHLFVQQIDDLRKGKAIEQPVYDFCSSTRLKETVHVEPCEVIIIEGIMTFYDDRLRGLMDLKVYVDVPADERLIRVILRDTVERGLTLEKIIDKYRKLIKPMHEKFIEPSKQYADLVVLNVGEIDSAIEELRGEIENRMRKL